MRISIDGIGLMQNNFDNFPNSFQPLAEWLFVCDIDDTFIGDDDATRELIDVARCIPALAIALNSSRPLKSVVQTLAQLPRGWRPLATVTAMGTEIAINGQLDEEWTKRFGGWDRKPIDDLAHENGWIPHPDEFQTLLKASYSLPPNADWQAARNAIASLKINTKVIISGAGELDVLPPTAGKGAATLDLARQLGVDLSRVVVAGDSANDLDMFLAAPKGIVVGNAREELRSALRPSESCFFATRSHAAGIIEGLHHFAIVSSTTAQTSSVTPAHTGKI